MYSVLGTQALVPFLLPTSEAKEYDTSLTGEHGVHMTVRKLMIARSHYVVHDLIKRGCGRWGSMNNPEQLRGTYSNVSTRRSSAKPCSLSRLYRSLIIRKKAYGLNTY
jgi:hypothetical protein